jgi:hypothetical protein
MRFWLSLAMVAALSSAAHGESGCARAYRLAHDKYVSEIDGLTRQRYEVYGGAAAAVAGFGVCMWRVKSWIVCTAMVGGVAAVAALYPNDLAGKMASLEQAYKVYNLYDDFLSADRASDDARGMLSRLGVQTRDELTVMNEMQRLMESGALCSGGEPKADMLRVEFLLSRAVPVK